VNLSKDICGLIATLQELSEEFFKKNRNQLVSIVLVGSLARKDSHLFSTGVREVDVLLISRYYYLLPLKKKYKNYVSRRIPGLEVHSGIDTLDRLQCEKSLFIYDLKYSGKVLAGMDVRNRIGEVTPNDLFPFEGFRLLLNRGIDIVEGVDQNADGRLSENSFFPIAARRMENACRDSMLIFHKIFDPLPINREKLLRDVVKGSTPVIKCFSDASESFKATMDVGLRLAGFASCEEMLDEMSQTFAYPFQFRIYTVLKTRKLASLFSNPIYNAFYLCHEILSNRLHKSWNTTKKEIIKTWKDVPQPLILRNEIGTIEGGTTHYR